ncbi:MAG: damage-inducible protein CinA [Flavobacteriaceae bacterium]|nr:damage-inducible protein CinA [Flavobacteriaceae bacterium]|tara:strand:+ start:2326 stop:3573 length:1248 start_codon:yes stop_codon:yes gene_type:complete
MKANIVTIGDEILIGQIIDTNSVFISKQLIRIGFEVKKIVSIGDTKEEILKTLEDSLGVYDLVILTGGLGPTNDDITKEAFCKFFNDKLVHNQEILNHIENLFKKFTDNPINELNRAQAFLPSKANLIPNIFGTAAGMSLKKRDTLYISLPGVPFEMKPMLENYIIPNLKKDFKCPYIVNRTLLTYGKGESYIAKKLVDFESHLPSNFKLAYLPNYGRVRLRLSAKSEDKHELESEMDSLVSKLYSIIGDIIVGYETLNPIELEIAKKLIKSNYTLSVAESLTGGLLSARLTSFPGASNFFKGSVTAYNTNVKINTLGVNKKTIKNHSVVSKEVADEMASNIKNILNSDFSISTTGNAGPTKGDSDCEIGKIFISIATLSDIKSFEFNFGNNREKNINKTVNKALELLFQEINSE